MKHITDDSFDAVVCAVSGSASVSVLVDFVATWCPPCHAMTPALEALAAARSDVDVVTLDVEESPAIAERYGVRAMPTLILFRGGQPIAQLVGAQPRAKLDAWLDEHLRSPRAARVA